MAKRKVQISARKKPSQARSQGLVEAILGAATRVLRDQGLDKSTTNRIAEIAGVSIGSLYQYFPNKESLIAGLVERQAGKNLRKIRAEFVRALAMTLGPALDHLAGEIAGMFLRESRFFSALFRHAPRLERLDLLVQNRAEGVGMMRQLLEAKGAETGIAPSDVPVTAFVAANAVMGVLQVAALAPDPGIDSEALVRELRRLLRSYLVKRP